MKPLILLVFTVLLLPNFDGSRVMYQYETECQDVRSADDVFIQAISESDHQRLTQVLDNDFSWIGKKGEVLHRADLLVDIPKGSRVSDEGREFRIFSGTVAAVLTQSGQFHTLRLWVKRKAGWRILAYHAVNQLPAPPEPHAGQTECNNPCKSLPYKSLNATEAAVISSWQALESNVTSHDSAAWATHVSDDFIQVSSNSDRVLDKSARMKVIDQQKSSDAGAAPPPLASARFDDLGQVVVMHALNNPLVGKPILVTRIWINRDGRWVMSVSFQTAIQSAGDASQ
jgi:hypothetical protein